MNAMAGRQTHSHVEWLKLEDEKRELVKSRAWKEEHLGKWLKDTEPGRMEAKKIYEDEQREMVDREEKEAGQRELQEEEKENADGDEEYCQLCRETGDIDEINIILPCSGTGCLIARHVGCCSPPLETAPDKVSTYVIVTSNCSRDSCCSVKSILQSLGGVWGGSAFSDTPPFYCCVCPRV